MLQHFDNNGETLAKMIKPFRHCKILDAKKFKRKSSFRNLGADFQKQPFTDDSLKGYS